MSSLCNNFKSFFPPTKLYDPRHKLQTHYGIASIGHAPPHTQTPAPLVQLSPDGQMTNALTDSLLAFRLLKVGGLLMVDDMDYPDVFRATVAFVKALEGENRLEVLHDEVRNRQHA